MPLKDVLAACLVMVLWGVNFVVIDWGLRDVPPLLFVALRFSVVLLALPFVPRPAAPLRRVLLVGCAMSLGQFGLLYTALAAGMPPGLASLVLQLQAVVTVVVAALVLAERPALLQWAGVGLGVVGLGVVALGRGGAVPLLALVLAVGAAVSWATGNVLVRHLKVPGGLGLTVWSALVVPVPLLALSLVVDGPDVVGHALTHLSARGVALDPLHGGAGLARRLRDLEPAAPAAPGVGGRALHPARAPGRHRRGLARRGGAPHPHGARGRCPPRRRGRPRRPRTRALTRGRALRARVAEGPTG